MPVYDRLQQRSVAMKGFTALKSACALLVVVGSTAFGAGMSRASSTTHVMPVSPAPATLSPAHVTGQPNQSCGSATAPNTPGRSAAAPGSAFNPDGKSGTVYAGEQPQNSRNTASVSQYDVACFRQPR
jgi:hypothetical protein